MSTTPEFNRPIITFEIKCSGVAHMADTDAEMMEILESMLSGIPNLMIHIGTERIHASYCKRREQNERHGGICE